MTTKFPPFDEPIDAAQLPMFEMSLTMARGYLDETLLAPLKFLTEEMGLGSRVVVSALVVLAGQIAKQGNMRQSTAHELLDEGWAKPLLEERDVEVPSFEQLRKMAKECQIDIDAPYELGDMESLLRMAESAGMNVDDLRAELKGE